MAKQFGANDENTTAHTPEFFTQGDGYIDPRVPVFPPFIYAFHPARWNMVGGKLAPQLRKVSLQGGVNQVTRDKAGRWHIAKLRAALETDGWKLIPYNKAPDGTTYVKTAKTRVGANLHTTHLSVWESTFQGSSEIGSDTKGYTKWMQSLIDSGFLSPCPQHIAAKLLERYRGELEAAEARVKGGVESFAAVVKVQRANVKALEKHLKGMERVPAKSSTSTPELA